MNIKSTYKLLSGFELPVLGFGVYKSPPEITSNSVQHALKSGLLYFYLYILVCIINSKIKQI